MTTWSEALFETIGRENFALILEKAKNDENLPTPPSCHVELISRGVSFRSGDFLKNPFRTHIKGDFCVGFSSFDGL